MPKNVMKMVKPSPHRARNDFDMSHRVIMDMNFGALYPVMNLETIPGDYFEIKVADLIRANTFVTSPFLRAKQHVDLWFVPYHDLWHNFEQFMVQREQPVSSALQGSTFLPHVNLWSLWMSIGNNAAPTGDIVGQDRKAGARMLLQELGYGFQVQGSDGTYQPSVNLFRLAAYNYIWYNEYRQQYYDDGTRCLVSGDNVAKIFNFDDLPCTSQANSDLSYDTNYVERLNAMTQRRYRTWKKDLYTGLMPATQFGNVSTFGTNIDSVSLFNLNSSSAITAANYSSDKAGVSSSFYGHSLIVRDSSDQWLAGTDVWSVRGSGIDVLSLRKSEAVQIWRENALRAGNRVKDNIAAHYGVDGGFRDHRPTYIGSVDAALNVSDVMATANGNPSGNTNPNVNVGDIGGKGLMSMDGNETFKFHAKDFGVIMAVASILPEAEYNASGIDRMNQLLESEDFFVPEYENLGLEPVSSLNFVQTPTNVAKVVGYAPRYFGYKTKLDKCFGTFKTGGINATWCSPKSDVTTAMNTPASQIPLATLYVNPALYDVNFQVAVATAPQFKSDFYFDVDAVRPMSVLGLPFS